MKFTKKFIAAFACVAFIAGIAVTANAQDKKAPAKKAPAMKSQPATTPPAPSTPSGTAAKGKKAPAAPKDSNKGAIKNPDGSTGDQATPEGENPENKEGAPAKKPGIFDNPIMLVLFGMVILMLIFSGRGRRKQEQKRKEMLSKMKKGDRVVSIGGIVGKIYEIRESKGEIVVTIDNSGNKMTFVRNAIQRVGDEAAAEKTEEKK